jgi:GH24 family phage-related lysozyme (muramidase)
MDSLSSKAAALILEFEGMDQPARWPGTDSGITIGHGFDLGYATRGQFEDAWRRYLSETHFEALCAALGVTGLRAKAIAPRFKGIILTKEEADEVFTRCTVPRWIKITAEAFPGVEKLPADAQGALVSLCFNRGASMAKGDKRREMREVRRLIGEYARTQIGINVTLKLIAGQIRAMKRHWPNVRGLQRRRDAEAALIESCAA